ncbi:MAG: antitoxin VbhA family protein, partial [Campylobacter sp.]|nr:antitoxin VbhA family protein [Campylobacter sp.]
SNIGSFAIEGMFLNQRNIIDNIKILKGEMTADEIIAEYKKKWSVSDLNNLDLEQNSKIEN